MLLRLAGCGRVVWAASLEKRDSTRFARRSTSTWTSCRRKNRTGFRTEIGPPKSPFDAARLERRGHHLLLQHPHPNEQELLARWFESISLLLSHEYLRYVLDAWLERVVKSRVRG